MPKDVVVRPIGLSGVARAGKDTFCQLIIEELKNRGVQARRFALADALKADLNDFLIEKFSISAFTTDPDEKTLIRDILVAYGKTHRIRSQGTYWTSKLQGGIEEAVKEGVVPIVTDIRYSYYEYDEVQWVKQGIGGYLVHITRDMVDGGAIPPANADEKENDPKVSAAADLRLRVPSVDDVADSSVLKWDALKIIGKLGIDGIEVRSS